VIPGLRAEFNERRTDDHPVWDRRNSNAAALRMIDARPLLGFGWGRFPEESRPYYRQSRDYPLTSVKDLHNLYLSNAVELGLVGASLWIAALLSAIGGAVFRRGPPELRPWKAGLIAVAGALFIGWALNPGTYLFPTLLMWTWAGVAWGGRGDGTPAAQSTGS
jgi:O-antigen ligase